MKFKYPKKILIGSTEFDIKYDKKQGGGEFSYPHGNKRGYIRIGIRDSEASMLDTFIHEVKEIINSEQGVRLYNPTCHEEYKFHYNHSEHTDFCARLAGILNQFIK